MLTPQIPMLLALLGTALMAVVIFAPAPAAATVTVSLAPLPAPPPFESPPFERWEPPPTAREAPAWPALFDARAAGCDAASRLALVDALATVRAPWAGAILRRALSDEPDALVRDAVAAALDAAAGERAC